MAVHEVSLIRSETVAEGTLAFHFERPRGFTHQAGQSLLLRLIDAPETDAEGDARTFTIASAPHEPDLMIATRMRDTAFKRVLRKAPPGTRVTIDGPDGQMVLHAEAARPAVLLAGGIGVTPFRAIAQHAAHAGLPHRLHLFYSNRRPEDAAFLEEFEQLQARNPNFRLIATMTKPQASGRPWSGETGVIRRDMLARHLQDLEAPIYYFAGPPAMTLAMHQMLDEMGVDERLMRYEEFYGY
ncbi:MAG: FAD-dependent oxidoreductase [Gammaproteobacteria bacterium]|nr:FAD-dependent oxidoreductase [Gammaproteobacteria bacterium]